ncbi:MAG: helix-turn-helix domain-containing protein [Lachnospiraceae bacterium]
MNQINKQISDNVKKFRRLNHLTQAQLAEKLSLDTQYYAQLERGERNFTIEKIALICEIFQIEIGEIIRLSDKEERNHFVQSEKISNITNKLNSLTVKQLVILEKYIDEILPLQK